nr:MAG TPA: hypothetical protein [Caudoviricetes sp.]
MHSYKLIKRSSYFYKITKCSYNLISCTLIRLYFFIIVLFLLM